MNFKEIPDHIVSLRWRFVTLDPRIKLASLIFGVAALLAVISLGIFFFSKAVKTSDITAAPTNSQQSFIPVEESLHLNPFAKEQKKECTADLTKLKKLTSNSSYKTASEKTKTEVSNIYRKASVRCPDTMSGENEKILSKWLGE